MHRLMVGVCVYTLKRSLIDERRYSQKYNATQCVVHTILDIANHYRVILCYLLDEM